MGAGFLQAVAEAANRENPRGPYVSISVATNQLYFWELALHRVLTNEQRVSEPEV